VLLYSNTASIRTQRITHQVIYRLERAAGVASPTLSAASVLESNTDNETGHVLSHFSAHDTTVAALLALLGSFGVDESAQPSAKGTNPPYASSVVVELFRDSTEKEVAGQVPLRVRVYYNKGVRHLFQNAPVELKCCASVATRAKHEVRMGAYMGFCTMSMNH
jgi:hypothetical protein